MRKNTYQIRKIEGGEPERVYAKNHFTAKWELIVGACYPTFRGTRKEAIDFLNYERMKSPTERIELVMLDD